MGKRICYVLPTISICGGVMVILEHANRLISRGFDISLLNTGAGKSLNWFPGNQACLYSANSYYPRDFDIVIATGWSTAYKARLLGLNTRRWVYLVQSDESRFVPSDHIASLLARMTYSAPYEYVVVAKWLKNWLFQTFGRNAINVPNAINEKLIFKTNTITKRTRRLRVLIEGPMHTEYKGMDDSFAAVKDLDVEVWCVTNGTPKRDYRYDRLFKCVPYDQMRTIYSSCDVLLKMSKVESFSYPPLEMMACGGTAVITRFTGHEEYACDGENCFVVDIGDVGAASERICQLSNDRCLLERIKRNAIETAARKTDWERSIDLLEEFCNLEQPATGAPTLFEEQSFHSLALLADKLLVDSHHRRLRFPSRWFDFLRTPRKR
jgi:O-antigen biosynthesis protein